MPKQQRVAPKGYVKTSFEIAQTTKWILEDLRTSLRRYEGLSGVSEAAVIETLILSARKEGVDTDVLAKVIRARKAAQDAREQASSGTGQSAAKTTAKERRTAK